MPLSPAPPPFSLQMIGGSTPPFILQTIQGGQEFGGGHISGPLFRWKIWRQTRKLTETSYPLLKLWQ